MYSSYGCPYADTGFVAGFEVGIIAGEIDGQIFHNFVEDTVDGLGAAESEGREVGDAVKDVLDCAERTAEVEVAPP